VIKRNLIMKLDKKNQIGFSTLELLLAMFIIILALSAVILVSFGSQTLLADSQTNAEALSLAQGMLENAQAQARKDFRLVNPASDVDGIYTKRVDVFTQADYLTKLVKATVNWTGEHNRPQSVQLSALVTNFENAVGGDTCDSVLSPNAEAWKNPQIKNATTNFTQLAGLSGSYPATDIDAYQGRLYVTAGNSPDKQDPTFFIFDISNPVSPALLSKIDNATSTAAGLNAVAVDGKYAYVANGYGAPYGTCINPDGSNQSCGQLQIIDINANPPVVRYTLKITGVTGTSGQAVGSSIFYKDGFIYLGLTKTANGPEFNIIDVHNPLVPVWVGSYAVGYAINGIYVKGGYAYLVHPTDSSASTQEQLTVLDVSNPSSPQRKSGYHAPDNQGHGKSLYLVGNTLYLGRTWTSSVNPEFYILNNIDPTKLFENNPNNPPYPVGQKINDSVDGVITRDYLTFLLTRSQFQIFKIDQTTNPWGISQWAPPLNLPASGSAVFEPVLDCEGNYFFVGSNDASDNGYISVITAQ